MILYNFINAFIGAIGVVANGLISILPDSPFNIASNADVQDYLGTLNWFVPIGAMVTELSIWLTAVATYYIVQAVLRWVRMIQ